MGFGFKGFKIKKKKTGTGPVGKLIGAEEKDQYEIGGIKINKRKPSVESSSSSSSSLSLSSSSSSSFSSSSSSSSISTSSSSSSSSSPSNSSSSSSWQKE